MKLLVFVVFESWSVFFLKLCLAFENCSEAEKRRKEAKESLIYKGKNLLAYKGRRDDHNGFGRFLSRCILTKEERIKTCWFAQRCTVEGRELASEEDEKYFRGIRF